MLLTVDIGNTNVVIGVFSGDELIAHWRMTTDARRTAHEYAVFLDALFNLGSVRLSEITGVIIGSVVPGVQASLVEVSRDYIHREPVVVSHQLDLGLPILYQPPTAVGADRIANALGAIATVGTPAIVVDFGTATTFDAINAAGKYAGGSISPGIEIAQEALFRATAQLPRVNLEPPPSAIGDTTVTSLQSGILYGYAGLVDGLVHRIASLLGPATRVVATGGLASTVAPWAESIEYVKPDLTLIGLRIIYERNR